MPSTLQYMQFIPRIILKKGLPVQLIFFVTARCNLNCIHCFYKNGVINKNENELSLEEIKKIAKKSKLNLLWLCLTGGEPSLRKDLPEIAELFCRFGKVSNIAIPTNGKDPKLIFDSIQKLLKLCANTYVSVNLSLDGLKRTHDIIRGRKNSFDQALETYKRLTQLKRRFKNFGLSVQTTIMSLNQKELPDLYDFVKRKLAPDNISLNLIRGKVARPELKNVNINYYLELVDRMEKDRFKEAFQYYRFPFRKVALARNFLGYRLIAKTYSEKRFIIPCNAGSLSGVMDQKGNVYPCEAFNLKMGSIKDFNYNFRTLWNSSDAKRVKNKIKRSKCFCTYECATSINVLFNSKFYPSMILKALKF